MMVLGANSAIRCSQVVSKPNGDLTCRCGANSQIALPIFNSLEKALDVH
jgi:hypothetical protein